MQGQINGGLIKGIDMNITKEKYDEALLVAAWINKDKPASMSNEDWQRIVQRNKTYLVSILNTFDFDGFDKQALIDASI
jgi:hypothetical protein